ncbi:RidA family protein [Williamsia sterculiae]|uniref:Enamine deaminase RidA, house cleaning of reactive enamine intermediates, YjgF/YER057c/UK114 family n=1 Tax=Williamsia sterculiae TaxID=1344003 RepID=A0A1N7GZ45_9NOCA|nr:RidA family protein [Williamsia sterculiae]SIS17790.1 Enamine deaminase RidA, house cleaning of reactive enamine intermediates, YjgF/YER057c/UK114 family [Williamsia sterculiae]
MAHIQRNSPDSLFDAGFTYSTTVAPGSLIFTAGVAPVDADGTTVAPGDVQGQTIRCLQNLGVVLEEAGATLADVVKLTVYVAEKLQVDLTVAWDAVDGAFDGNPPPGSLLGVAVLRHDDQVVEIEAVAAVPAS